MLSPGERSMFGVASLAGKRWKSMRLSRRVTDVLGDLKSPAIRSALAACPDRGAERSERLSGWDLGWSRVDAVHEDHRLSGWPGSDPVSPWPTLSVLRCIGMR